MNADTLVKLSSLGIWLHKSQAALSNNQVDNEADLSEAAKDPFFLGFYFKLAFR